jgi:hypothetical protein
VYDDESSDAYTTRYLVSIRLSYSLSRNFTVSVEDRFAYVYSPDIVDNNYRKNRVIVELSKEL